LHMDEEGLLVSVNELRKIPSPASAGGRNALVPRLQLETSKLFSQVALNTATPGIETWK
jgi:hypothetical protein